MFKNIFLPAIKATWQSKFAWIIALLTITPFTIVNEWSLIARIVNAVNNPHDYFWYFSHVKANAFGFQDLISVAIEEPIGIISLIIVLILGITLLMFIAWILVNAQAIIIYTQAPKHQETNYSLKGSLAKVEKLWIPLFQLNIGMVIARILVISALLPILAKAGSGASQLLYWIIFAALIIGITLLSFAVRLAIFKVVLERKTIQEAFIEGKQFVQKNALACYELSFLLYAFSYIVLGIVLFLILLIVSPVEFSVSILSVLLLESGPVPLIVMLTVITIVAVTAGWIALVKYNVWLSWSTEVTHKGSTQAYTHRLLHFTRSHVKRTKIN